MKKAFNLEPIKLKLDDLIETVRDSLINRSRAYASILTSIKEVGRPSINCFIRNSPIGEANAGMMIAQ